MDELLQDFLEEAKEHLDSVDQLILELEKAPERKDLITSLFRDIHSIKGTCGMFGFEKLSNVSHKTEDLLGKMREGEIRATKEIISLLFVSFDVIRFILTSIEKSSEEPNQEFSKLVLLLEKAMGQSGETAQIQKEENTIEVEKEEQVIEEEKEVPHVAPTAENEKTPVSSSGSETLKVNLSILDHMMNGVGELVLARNQLIELLKKNENSEFANSIHQLNHITSILQETVMKTRMRPIGEAWSKLPRMVRDLERATQKKINLVLKGESTELDRQILQCIQDPLTHCVRNSADHGLELPSDRSATGKDEAGSITLEARQEGGSIIISIQDDGKGIDTERIKAKSIEKGIITEEQASKLSEEQALQLIFEPGFSTAEKITEISGRGVGMDVVKTSIQKLGGSVKIYSSLGKFSKVEFRIPLTMAIVSALTVRIKEEQGFSTYAIPQMAISELIQIGENSRDKVHQVNNSFVIKLRNKLLPLVDLKKLTNPNSDQKIKNVQELENKTIIILSVDDCRFGLVVDEVSANQEIVVKAISKSFNHIKFLSGATILGDGTVVLILDPSHLIAAVELQKAEVENQEESLIKFSDISSIDDYLLFETNDYFVKSLPIKSVDRLEEFASEKIERVDGMYVVQYRGILLPLYQNSEGDDLVSGENKMIPTVIMRDGEKTFGIMTRQVVDIASAEGDLDKVGEKEEVQGSTVIRGKATEVLDPHYFSKMVTEDLKRVS